MTPAGSELRIPTLDGWRAIAILLVIISHSQIALYREFHSSHPGAIGQHGVTLFFVLSGFLITTRLQQESVASGSIQLRSFYIRRFFRLMPCAWLYLLVMLLATAHTHPASYTALEIYGSLLFFRNYLDPNAIHAITGHFWSLSIEEQFYLLWPAVLLFAGAKRARSVALFAAAAIAAFRFQHWATLSQLPLAATFRTEYRADALLVGCATALFLPKLRGLIRSWMTIPLVAMFTVCIASYHKLIPMHEAIVIALLIAATSEIPGQPLSRLLEWKPLAKIGTFSYSLYIWQQVFVLGPHNPGAFCISVAILPIVAFSSYVLVEKPLIRFGRKLAIQCTTRPRHLESTPVLVGISSEPG